MINALAFLVLIRLEMVLAGKRYTAPMPVYADGNVGTAQPREVVPEKPKKPREEVSVQSQIIEDTILAAA